jgi:hypothetical protein
MTGEEGDGLTQRHSRFLHAYLAGVLKGEYQRAPSFRKIDLACALTVCGGRNRPAAISENGCCSSGYELRASAAQSAPVAQRGAVGVSELGWHLAGKQSRLERQHPGSPPSR